MFVTQQLIGDTFATWTRSGTHGMRRQARDHRLIARARRHDD